MTEQIVSTPVIALRHRVAIGVVIFATILLFVNLIINGIVFSSFWPSFGLALAVLALGIATVRYRFARTPKNRWIVIVSVLASIGVIAAAPLFFTQGIQHALTYANFYFMRDDYLKKVAMVEKTEVPQFIAFRWDSFNKQLLIFDESDELHDADQPKSKEWWQRAKKSEPELARCMWSDMKVAEHFYRVSISCEYPYSGSPIPSP